jgi:hypothetical protein
VCVCVCVCGGGGADSKWSFPAVYIPTPIMGRTMKLAYASVDTAREVYWLSSELLGAAHNILRTHVIVAVRRTVSYLDGVETAPPVESFLSVISGSVLRRQLLDL